MFENKHFVDFSIPTRQEEPERPSWGFPAKSSVKVGITVEDEEQLVSENEQTQNAFSQLSQHPNDVLAKFANYVHFHAVEPQDIWEHKKAMQYLVFVDTLQRKIGYKFNAEQILSLKAISSNDTLTMRNFVSLGIWNQKGNLKTSLPSTLSQKSIFDIKKRNSSLKNLYSKVDTRKSQEKSFIQTKTFKKTGGGDKSRMRTTCDQLIKTFLKNGFVTDESKDNKIEALREDLQMNALEKKWELVVMAGEMNKWIYDSLTENDHENNRVPVRFKIVNSSSNFSILKVDQESHEQIIPEVVFYKKYHALKKKQSSSKQIEPKAVNQALVGLAGIILNKSPTNKCNQRDKELNEALLHIMRIKNILQHQHKILTETAINT